MINNLHDQSNKVLPSPLGGNPTTTEHIDDNDCNCWADYSSYNLGKVDHANGFLLLSLSLFQMESAE
jgi:hypothetical protein